MEKAQITPKQWRRTATNMTTATRRTSSHGSPRGAANKKRAERASNDRRPGNMENEDEEGRGLMVVISQV
jgi:hypothetical protein